MMINVGLNNFIDPLYYRSSNWARSTHPEPPAVQDVVQIQIHQRAGGPRHNVPLLVHTRRPWDGHLRICQTFDPSHNWYWREELREGPYFTARRQRPLACANPPSSLPWARSSPLTSTLRTASRTTADCRTTPTRCTAESRPPPCPWLRGTFRSTRPPSWCAPSPHC